MGDPRTFWLTVTNLVLGAAVILLILVVATGILCEAVANWRKRHALWREMDKEMRHLFHDGPGPVGRHGR